ncbi:histone H1 [Pedobacter miscanthi]|uniref:Histone H1 n=1 Tax=Pedobacter miscanthi TaxID=2259170 RepID=A0A366KZ33_9SPHI|nr:histone H1 [Pedobacter miscanthi]RBQ06848.1 histone H1 [Pedobacter miscanthi]
MKTFDSLKGLVLGAEEDALKFFEKGNQAAGTRLRLAMQKAKLLAQSLRVEVSESKKKK